MAEVKKVSTPMSEEAAGGLRAGDEVLLSGEVFTARDMAHKRLCELIEKGESLPIELAGAVIYFVGPTPARAGAVIGSAGPTTSSRMDGFSPLLLSRGLKGMIGKGHRGAEVVAALKENGAVHFAATGGAGALLSKHIVSCEVVAYDDLGTEAIRRLVVDDFPVIVAYDSVGGCVYDNIGEVR